jgi:hypothetical protein
MSSLLQDMLRSPGARSPGLSQDATGKGAHDAVAAYNDRWCSSGCDSCTHHTALVRTKLRHRGERFEARASDGHSCRNEFGTRSPLLKCRMQTLGGLSAYRLFGISNKWWADSNTSLYGSRKYRSVAPPFLAY